MNGIFEIKEIASLGVGTILAILIFLMYRRDRKTSEEQLVGYTEQLRQDRVFMEDRMDGIINRDQVTREKNTEATVALTVLLEKMNGRH